MLSIKEKNKLIANKRWERVHKERIEFIKSRSSGKFLPVKAAILGYLIGDGSVFTYKDRNGTNHYGISFYPDDENVAKKFIDYFHKIYGLNLKLKQEKNHYSIKVKNKAIYHDLISITSFGSLNWSIPHGFLHNTLMKVEFLKAFFDCGAYVSKKMIQLQSVNKYGLEDIKKMLEGFEIESKIYRYERKQKNWNTNYILCIMKKDSKEKYLKKIGFSHTPKLRKITIYHKPKNNNGKKVLENPPDNKKISIQEAELIGFLAGDGKVAIYENKTGRAYSEIELYLGPNLELAKYFQNLIYNLYLKKPKIRLTRKGSNCYQIRFSSLQIAKRFLSLAKFKSLDWNIPINVLDTNEKKAAWLRGIFEAEGHVNRRTIQIQSVNKNGLNEIKSLLKKLNIFARGVYVYERKQKNWNTNYLLNINRKEERAKFKNSIGFISREKNNKLINSIHAGMAESG